MENPNPAISAAIKDDVVRLAVAEGHDADIPSNAGVITGEQLEKLSSIRTQTVEADEADLDKDLEKNGANLFSGLTSTPSNHPIEDEGHDSDESSSTVVWWEGDDDPENPLNWPSARRWGAVVIVSGITFLTPLASSIFAPGISLVLEEFQTDSKLLSGFVLSVYVLGFAFGPLIIAPCSEMYGRLKVYHTCNVFFIIFTICCAVSNSMTMLIVFRFLAGSFGSAPLTLGGGTIADVMPIRNRAKGMAFWCLGPVLGPVVGPVCGGFVSKYLGWRWNFWIVSIAGGVGTVLCFIFMKETYAPYILEQKAKRLRKETGNPKYKSKLDIGLTPKDYFWFSIVRPTKMLLFSPIVLTLSIYVAITYAYLYLFFTTISTVFRDRYHFREDLVGLGFLGLGLGQFVGQFVYSWLATRSYERHQAKGGFRPEHRLRFMVPGAFLVPVSLFWYGWAVQARSHWINPEFAMAVFSFGILLIWMPANVYLIDCFTVHAASAMAANTVFRSVVAAILPLAGPSMYDKLGYGWGTSVLGFVAVVCMPIPFFFIKYGGRIRARSTLKL